MRALHHPARGSIRRTVDASHACSCSTSRIAVAAAVPCRCQRGQAAHLSSSGGSRDDGRLRTTRLGSSNSTRRVRATASSSDTEASSAPTRRAGELEVASAADTVTESTTLLEWPRVCAQVACFAATPAGHAAARAALPLGESFDASAELLEQTCEATRCSMTFDGVYDVAPQVMRTQRGVVLSGKSLAEIASTLRCASALKATLAASKSEALLRSTRGSLSAPTADVLAALDDCVDASGFVQDSASEALAAARAARTANATELRMLLEALAKKLYDEGGAERAQLVTRRGRQCLPVRRGQQGLLPSGGVVLAESASGATLFMEPNEALPLNNAEVTCAAAVDEAEQAVRADLSALVAARSDAILAVQGAVTTLDLAAARAAHMAWLGACIPTLLPPEECCSMDPAVQVDGIQHPLLLQPALTALPTTWDAKDELPVSSTGFVNTTTFKPKPKSATAKKAEPPQRISFPVPAAARAVAITGPNTGGKTASLKTIGLAALMAKAGLGLVSEKPATLMWFDRVLVDLGDGQSLEQSLSTFSGHVRRLRNILAALTPHSLVLVDELGSGTDPSEGAALAAAILTRFAEGARLTFATSHFAELKAMAQTDERFATSAVEFDTVALKPTYKLLWGEVGNSNALDIAAGLGLPPTILKASKEIMATELSLSTAGEQQKTGALMQSLFAQAEQQRARTQRRVEEEQSVAASVEAMRAEITRLEQNGDELRAAARAEAAAARDAAVAAMEAALTTEGADNGGSSKEERLRRIDAAVKAFSVEMDVVTVPVQGDDGEAWEPIVGSSVHVNRLGKSAVATVAAVSTTATGVRVTVKLGRGIEMHVRLDELTPAEAEAAEAAEAAKPSSAKTQARPKPRRKGRNAGQESDLMPGSGAGMAAIQFKSNTADLRGMRVDDGLGVLDNALNRMANSGTQALFVVHGVGTGQMKTATLAHLKTHVLVDSFHPQEGNGGDGCTVVNLRQL